MDLNIQEIIDALSAGYDAGLLTREDVYRRLVKWVEDIKTKRDIVDRLFDLIVG